MSHKLEKEEQNDTVFETESTSSAVAEFDSYGEDDQESPILNKMKIRNRVFELLNDVEGLPLSAADSKSVTIRLNFNDYAKIKVLSGHLGQTPSAFAKNLVTDGLSEALNAYFEFKNDDFSVQEFIESSKELELSLFIEAGEDT